MFLLVPWSLLVLPSMYLYFVVKTALFLPKMATNTLRLVGFSSEIDWKITA